MPCGFRGKRRRQHTDPKSAGTRKNKRPVSAEKRKHTPCNCRACAFDIGETNRPGSAKDVVLGRKSSSLLIRDAASSCDNPLGIFYEPDSITLNDNVLIQGTLAGMAVIASIRAVAASAR